MDKIQATNYILLQLSEWYFELNPDKKESGLNDLSILKTLKLIFLLTSIEKDNNYPLLDVFNNYKALPLGPVEISVYDYFKENHKNFINYNTLFNINSIEFDLNVEEISIIDNSIMELKRRNSNLINKPAFYLVDLTHEWTCWKNNVSSKNQIKKEDIIDSVKYYSY